MVALLIELVVGFGANDISLTWVLGFSSCTIGVEFIDAIVAFNFSMV